MGIYRILLGKGLTFFVPLSDETVTGAKLINHKQFYHIYIINHALIRFVHIDIPLLMATKYPYIHLRVLENSNLFTGESQKLCPMLSFTRTEKLSEDEKSLLSTHN